MSWIAPRSKSSRSAPAIPSSFLFFDGGRLPETLAVPRSVRLGYGRSNPFGPLLLFFLLFRPSPALNPIMFCQSMAIFLHNIRGPPQMVATFPLSPLPFLFCHFSLQFPPPAPFQQASFLTRPMTFRHETEEESFFAFSYFSFLESF